MGDIKDSSISKTNQEIIVISCILQKTGLLMIKQNKQEERVNYSPLLKSLDLYSRGMTLLKTPSVLCTNSQRSRSHVLILAVPHKKILIT